MASNRILHFVASIVLSTRKNRAAVLSLVVSFIGFAGRSIVASAQQLISSSSSSNATSSALFFAPSNSHNLSGPKSPAGTSARHRHEMDFSLGVAAQLTGTRFINGHAQSNGATPTAVLLTSFHEQFKPLVGYNVNFGYTKMTENYTEGTVGFNPTSPSFTAPIFGSSVAGGSIPTNTYEISSAYVIRGAGPTKRFRTFAQVGGGVLIFAPTVTPYQGYNSYRAAGLFGAGVEYAVTRRLGLKAEYRGLFYKNPDFGAITGPVPTNKLFTVTNEPTLSLTYRLGGPH